VAAELSKERRWIRFMWYSVPRIDVRRTAAHELAGGSSCPDSHHLRLQCPGIGQDILLELLQLPVNDAALHGGTAAGVIGPRTVLVDCLQQPDAYS
jgi:hypothetical protein